MHYRHLCQEESYQISALMDAGHTLRSITLRLGRPASTISREVRRNRAVRPSQPQTAILLAAARRQHSAANARRVPEAAWLFAMEKLPSPVTRGLGHWSSTFRGHLCLHCRYGPTTRSPSFKMALSMDSRSLVSLPLAIQATGLLTLAPVGLLLPTEYTCLL